jgi:hypothetical protein
VPAGHSGAVPSQRLLLSTLPEGREGLLLAGHESSSDSTEWLLNDVLQPSRRRGPLWIVEPPLVTGARMSVNDPFRSF